MNSVLTSDDQTAVRALRLLVCIQGRPRK